MKRSFYYIVLLFILSLLGSCSTKKNTKVTRFYHSFNSRYNIYYNGKLSFDESLDAMQTGYTESYTDMILMYPISAQPKDKETPGGSFDRAIEKGNKAIKLHSIKAKPAKKPGWRNNPKQRAFQEQEEYNPFLKHCWLLIGQSQFYNADFLQAAATFSYIARHYSQDEEVVAEARIWQARCYSEMEWFYEAEDILGKLNINGMPKSKLNDYATVYADYLVKNKKYEEAIPYFKTAIKAEKNGRQRTRMKYLLGQIYADQELNDLAYKTFGEVIKANPPYELEFAARIRQTEVFSGTNFQKVVKMLGGMAKSEKNTNYLDQVYYALGNVYLSREDTVQAIANYELGAEKSVQNGMDKAILWIKLGDIYFQQRNYMKAQPCFSGAIGIIQKEYKDYERVAKLSAVLDELVVHVEAVHLQDSLQALAKMPESERLAVIDKIIEQVIKEEEEAKADAERAEYLAEQEAMGTGIDRPGTESNVLTIPTAGGGTFYFYNSQTVSQGKTQFQRKWGRRTLEDDWRRRNKRVTTFDENLADTQMNQTGMESDKEVQLGADGEPLPVDSLATGLPEEMSDDPKTREYYLQQIPFTEEDIEASNVIIVDGLYNMAMIYKDKLEDLPLSIEAFEELERRFPANAHSLESYYQIFLMTLRTGNTALSSHYKSKIRTEYPESDYAIALADPDYEYNIRMMDAVQDSTYERTYERYLAEDIHTVRENYKEMSEKYPLATLLPKFMFLDALTYVQEGDAEGFKEALKALVEKYPDADVSELAGEMLKGVLRGREIVQGGVRGMIWNMRFGEGELTAADSARTFSTEKNQAHRLMLMYPSEVLDKNQLLFAVAAYNFSNFLVKTFDLAQEESGSLSTLSISGFVNFEEIHQYYKMIYGKDGYASSLGGEVAVIPISDENYETLMRGKTLEEYIAFLEENFSEEAPELVGRLKTRIEKDEEAAGEEEKAPVITVAPETEQQLAPDIPVIIEQPLLIIEDAEVIISPVELDTVQTNPPVQEEDEGLTLKDIQEMRKREAEEKARLEEEERLVKEAYEKEEQERAAQLKKEQEEARKKQQQEEEALLKAKREREKQLVLDRKEKQKQTEADRKARLKAREQLRKEKEREYKERLKQKEKERKAKEREYKQKLQEKEKARREAQKAKESSARKR
ncbi:hypothetical protein M2459_001673 [Parabacteroides sp. PF5-5]|uniref:type IX secretion system periplasmic lipoprotein PorW/SprE n=1 Tax=unclassified Parabacteroides TaxID=2649774 RepID=UPI002472E9AF|nr:MULTISPECIES: tetratricopeptide repeat protein [unclassified Parabacteroides]MDH6304936.1 hypothetical protein [Parabacteroides sp. PH5-39]MDH6315978.1 hypothetical protein [Parabacteroides sp. PF5-13]MDH6319635.1 hypothetical protein [Parabacteroides sp. PH5-13]MDH6323366.1 hypothetical protein [Parabacteroides sp. PH5-8]MDH6327125.1 hypothetical protein [Parabacteroides sp. PH5-41]